MYDNTHYHDNKIRAIRERTEQLRVNSLSRHSVLTTPRQYNTNAYGSSECYGVSMDRVLDAYNNTIVGDYYYNNKY